MLICSAVPLYTQSMQVAPKQPGPPLALKKLFNDKGYAINIIYVLILVSDDYENAIHHSALFL